MSLLKKCNKKEIVKWGLGAGFLESAYILILVMFFNVMEDIAPQFFINNQFVAMTFMIVILTFSVGLSGILVFGRPVYLWTHKKFREAGWTLGVTLLFLLVVIMVIVLVAVRG